jgi:hypothetical protein
MTTYHDELKWRRRRYLRDCMLCRWGSLRHCDFALSYPHLGIAERWDLLRHRERVERWYPFRNRSGDVNLRPPTPRLSQVFFGSISRSQGTLASVCPGGRCRGVAGRRHLDWVPRASWLLRPATASSPISIKVNSIVQVCSGQSGLSRPQLCSRLSHYAIVISITGIPSSTDALTTIVSIVIHSKRPTLPWQHQ